MKYGREAGPMWAQTSKRSEITQPTAHDFHRRIEEREYTSRISPAREVTTSSDIPRIAFTSQKAFRSVTYSLQRFFCTKCPEVAPHSAWDVSSDGCLGMGKS